MIAGVTVIDSPHNPRIRAAADLRDRQERVARGLTLVDGARESRRALEAGATVETAFVCPPLLRSDEAAAAVAALAARGISPVEISRRAFDKVAFGDRADGIVLVVAVPPARLGDLELGAAPFLLVTEDVEKPGNLGAILRTADAAGCDAVIAIGGTDLLNPNVIRASLGVVFSMPLAGAAAGDALAWLRERGVRPVATRVDAVQSYAEADLRGPLAIILGSEVAGLSETWLADGVEAVRVPMLGVADSLNVAATAAVLAFEARRQRGFELLSSSSRGGLA
jgi:RNA methyltransferase, TrmH family